MSLNAAAVQILVDKGLSAQDIADVMVAAEKKKDGTAAERQARYRARKKASASRRNSNGVSPPIDNNHTPRDISPNGESHSPATDAEAVLDVWAGMAKPLGLSCWEKVSSKRRRIINARLKEHGFDAVKRAIEHVPKSAFLRGEAGNWNGANLDFLMRPDNITKILEGQYDNRTKAAANDYRKPTGTATAAQRAIASLGG